jgi:hypothetical protein
VILETIRKKLKKIKHDMAYHVLMGHAFRLKVLSQIRQNLMRKLVSGMSRHHPCPDCGDPIQKKSDRCAKCSVVHRFYPRQLLDRKKRKRAKKVRASLAGQLGR